MYTNNGQGWGSSTEMLKYNYLFFLRVVIKDKSKDLETKQ
jgi:hypothetical protein